MPSAYKLKPIPAGALGHSQNPETIRRNQHRASLTPLETAYERARANRGNRLKQRRDFARKYEDYKALDEADKAEVDCAMIAEENQILEQERAAILADWKRYYPNQFGKNGSPLADPPIPVEVDSPESSPAQSVYPSPKVRPAVRMKSLLNRVVKRPRRETTSSSLPASSQLAPSPTASSSRIPARGTTSSFAIEVAVPSHTLGGSLELAPESSQVGLAGKYLLYTVYSLVFASRKQLVTTPLKDKQVVNIGFRE